MFQAFFFWSFSFNALAVVALSLGLWELPGSNEQENSSPSLICSYTWWPLILEVVLAMLSDAMLLKLVRRVFLDLMQYVCIKCSSLKRLRKRLDSILWETVTFDWLLKRTLSQNFNMSKTETDITYSIGVWKQKKKEKDSKCKPSRTAYSREFKLNVVIRV